tara:strand:+ start:163 stop:378 length:216 start_codon:yes stop_codon:yes gene_type:complete
MPSSLTVGTTLTNLSAFVSPIGDSFRPGTLFCVDLVGRSTRIRTTTTDCVVWIQGSTLTAAASSAGQFRPV